MPVCTYCDFYSSVAQTVTDHIAIVHPEGANEKPDQFASLAAAKTWRYKHINKRTRELIEVGFTYSGQQMALYTQNQVDAMALLWAEYLLKEPYSSNILTGAWTGAGAGLGYPFTISNKDDSNFITISNRTELKAYYLAGVAAIQPIITAASAIKIQVQACTTIDEVLAIVDNR